MLCAGAVGSVGRDMDAVILYDSGLIHPIPFLSYQSEPGWIRSRFENTLCPVLSQSCSLSLTNLQAVYQFKFCITYFEKFFCKH